MCYYFDDIIKLEDFDLDNIFVYNISYKTLIHTKHLRISFYKIHGFIKAHDGIRYLVLFGGEKYDFIYNRIRHLVGVKSGVICVTSHNYAKIKVDS